MTLSNFNTYNEWCSYKTECYTISFTERFSFNHSTAASHHKNDTNKNMPQVSFQTHCASITIVCNTLFHADELTKEINWKWLIFLIFTYCIDIHIALDFNFIFASILNWYLYGLSTKTSGEHKMQICFFISISAKKKKCCEQLQGNWDSLLTLFYGILNIILSKALKNCVKSAVCHIKSCHINTSTWPLLTLCQLIDTTDSSVLYFTIFVVNTIS